MAGGQAALGAISDLKTDFDLKMAKTLESVDSTLIEIQSHAASAEAIAGTTRELSTSVEEHAQSVSRVRDSVQALLADSTKKSAEIVSDAAATLATAKSADRQLSEYSANGKALLQAVTDARAAIESQLQGVTEFYAAIESHKREMLETRKAASAAAMALESSMDQKVTAYGNRTEKVIEDNVALNGQIQAHLAAAVGVGLFKAFENRRKSLFKVAYFWVTLLLTSIVGAVIFALYLATSFGAVEVNNRIFVARLLAAVPLAFFIGFVARQYSRERRAEEEYAFKSSISVSLNAYRELIEKMRKEGDGAETEFVKELIRDVFDNPTKRLYPESTQRALDEEGDDKKPRAD